VKKVGDLFADLGFREDGSDGVKRAFIENLVKAAGGDALRRAALRPKLDDRLAGTRTSKPIAKTPPRAPARASRGEQLSFDFHSDFEPDEPESPLPLTPKRTAG
jgi:hypothetical protein